MKNDKKGDSQARKRINKHSMSVWLWMDVQCYHWTACHLKQHNQPLRSTLKNVFIERWFRLSAILITLQTLGVHVGGVVCDGLPTNCA